MWTKMNLFSSDFHFGHKVIAEKYRQKFSSNEEHDHFILDQIAKMNKRDILFVLGDFIFDSEKYDWYIEQLSKMSPRIKLIMGNHDSRLLYKETRLPKLEIQLPLYSYKGNWLSHCPIHPDELRGKFNIHGHLHNANLDDSRYFDVSPEKHNFKFVDFEEIKDTLVKLNNL